MREVRFRITISADEFIRYYQGTANSVLVNASDGRIVQFPANVLQKFVDHSGINGSFRILYDRNNKLVRVEKVSN